MKHITKLNKRIVSLLLVIQLISLVLLPGIAHALSVGSVESWNTTTTFPSNIDGATSVTYNGYVYEIGGNNGGGPVDTVYYAPLNANGTVGTWQSTTPLTSSLFYATSVVNNGYVYEIGGNTDGSGNDPTIGVYYGALTPSPSTTTATFSNVSNGASISLTTPSGTNITCATSESEASLSKQDNGYSYPLGLVNLCFTTASTNNQVSLTFVTNLTPSQVVARDYNTATETYTNVSGAVIAETTYNGQPALQLSYNLADNGPLDSNPATGAITDPVGLAVQDTTPTTSTSSTSTTTTSTSSTSTTTPTTSPSSTSTVATPNTGYGQPTHLSPIVTLIAISSLVSISLGLTLIYKRRHIKV